MLSLQNPGALSQLHVVDAFPFHLVVERNLQLAQVGPALQRVCPELRPGLALERYFRVLHPESHLACGHLFERLGDIVLIVHVASGLRLRGELVLQEGGDRLLLLGSPWATDLPPDNRSDTSSPSQDMAMREELDSLRASGAESRKLALIALNSDSAVILTDALGRIEWVNEAFVRITGYHLHEVLGKVPGAVLQGPATDPAVVRRMGERLRSGRGFREEVLNYAKNGRPYWLAIEVQPITDDDGRITNYMGIERDISAEVSLRTQKTVQMEVWKLLLEAPSQDAGLQGLLRLFCSAFGSDTGQVWGMDESGLRVAHCWPGGRVQDSAMPAGGAEHGMVSGFGLPARVRQSLQVVVIPDTVKAPASPPSDAMRRAGIRSALAFPVSVDGHFWGVFVFLGPAPLPDGEAVRRTCALADGQIGQFLARCNLHEALRNAKELAVRASESKSQFIATLSHEIRTPLNAVIGLGSLLARLPMGQRQQEYVQTIRQSSEQVLAIVNDVLDLSRLEAGHAPAQAVDFPLASLVDNMIRMARALPGAECLDVGSELDPALPAFLRCDAARLTQVLINLLGNAVKFTERGSVRLRVSCEPAAGPGLWVSFSVADSGQGIAAALQQRIFEPFEQGASAPGTAERGSGLGLAICRRIAAVMGGTLTLQSTEGSGSTFTFCLPVEAGSATVTATSPAPGAAHPPLRILVADDTPSSLFVIRSILESLGHSVLAVADGDMAVEAARRESFDLVFLDMQMRRMDGCQAAREIRAGGLGKREMPIVGVSAHAQDAAREAALAHGMTHYLCKPIHFEDVERLLDAMLASQQLQAPAEPAIDREMLMELCELMTPDGFSQALQQFDQDVDAALVRLQEHAQTSQEEPVPRLAHRLKGLFAQFGAMEAAGAMSALEQLPEGERCVRALALVGQARGAAIALRRVADELLRQAR